MAKTRGSYPHPVLDHSDDVLTSFSLDGDIKVRTSPETISIEFGVVLDDFDVHRYLAAGQMGLFVRWQCPSTFEMEQCIPKVVRKFGDSMRLEFAIEQSRVAGRVDCAVNVVALEEVHDYSLASQNSDYGDACFHILRGDLVGYAGTFSVDARKMYDPMRPPLNACFVFQEDAMPRERGIRIDFEDDVIHVLMPKATHSNFSMLKSKPKLQLATVMMPALMAALSLMKDDRAEDDYSERPWFRSLSKLLNERGIQQWDPFVQAQELLQQPIDEVLGLESVIDEVENDS